MSDSYNNSSSSWPDVRTVKYVAIIFAVTKFLLLVPLIVTVLVVARQRWRQRRSGAAISHSDILTYHMVVMETFGLLMSVLNCCILFIQTQPLNFFLTIFFGISYTGQLFFHSLTCIERYMAVVHPVTYLHLQGRHTVKIIYTSTGFALLLCSAWLSLALIYTPNLFYIPAFVFLIASLVVVSFCSLTVLCALRRPGPGEGDRDRATKSKRRVFFTITAIMGVLLVWFLGVLVCSTVGLVIDLSSKYLMWIVSLYFTLPSSLVIPLLFLHKAEKLPCCSYRSG